MNVRYDARGPPHQSAPDDGLQIQIHAAKKLQRKKNDNSQSHHLSVVFKQNDADCQLGNVCQLSSNVH